MNTRHVTRLTRQPQHLKIKKTTDINLLLLFLEGWDWVHLVRRPWPIVMGQDDRWCVWGIRWDDRQAKPTNSEETYPSVTLPTCPRLEPGTATILYGTAVSGGKTGPPCNWGHKYTGLVLQVGAGRKVLRNLEKWKRDDLGHDNLARYNRARYR
jgi:hypothetical protein